MSILGVESTHKNLFNRTTTKSNAKLKKNKELLFNPTTRKLRKHIVDKITDESTEPSTILKNRKALCYLYIAAIFVIAMAILSMGAIFLLQLFMLP